MYNLRKIREHGAKDERKRILKLIDEIDFYGTDNPLSVLEKLKSKING